MTCAFKSLASESELEIFPDRRDRYSEPSRIRRVAATSKLAIESTMPMLIKNDQRKYKTRTKSVEN